jgi:hypothetical protein
MTMVSRATVLTVVLALAAAPGFPREAGAPATGWTYIQVDDERAKWGDFDEPEWLRYFGLDAADMDGDGDLDLVSGRYVYRNPDGDMTSWERLDLGANVDGMLAVDVDGDAHPDVIAQALPEVVWLEAEDDSLRTWRRTVVGELPKTGHNNGQGYVRADLDGDGRPEVLLAAADGVYAARIPDEPAAGPWPWVRVVTRGTDEGFAVADMDEDGDRDIVGGDGPPGDEDPTLVAWWANPGRLEESWSRHVVGETAHAVDRVAAVDLNGDGRTDVAISEERYPGLEPDAHLWWFEATADAGASFERHPLIEQYSMNNLDAGDVDGDGDVDLVTGEHKGPHLRLQVFENDGRGGFTVREIDRGKECHLGTRLFDLDGDGDLDIVGHAWDTYRYLHLWRNDGGFSSPGGRVAFRQVTVDQAGPHDPWTKIGADLDGDGRGDLVVGGREGPLVWYRSPEWTKHLIAEGGWSTVGGAAGDVDGDGDIDIVMGGTLWYENPGSLTVDADQAWTAHPIAEDPTHDVALADLDGDGRLDVVTRNQSEFGARAGNRVRLWLQGAGGHWRGVVLDCPHGEGLAVADLDVDGDPDVVTGALWFETVRATDGTRWEAHVLADTHPNVTVAVADFSGDGRPDVALAPSELAGQVGRFSWFEAPADPRNGSWREHLLVEEQECVVHSLAAADVDRDGRTDIAFAEMHQGADPDVVGVFLNRDDGWRRQVLSTEGSHGLQTVDVDGDGDVDLLGANHGGPRQGVRLWENHTPAP